MTDQELEELLSDEAHAPRGAKHWAGFGKPVIDPHREYLLEMACRIQQQHPGANAVQIEKAVGLPSGSIAKYRHNKSQFRPGPKIRFFNPNWTFRAPDMSDFIPTLTKLKKVNN